MGSPLALFTGLSTHTFTDTFDYWFCGYTSYYTGAVWTGYPNSEVINRNYKNPSVLVRPPMAKGLRSISELTWPLLFSK